MNITCGTDFQAANVKSSSVPHYKTCHSINRNPHALIIIIILYFLSCHWCRREIYAGFWWGNMNDMNGKT